MTPTDCSPPGSLVHGASPGKNTGVGCHALLQGIFPTQGPNPGLPHCRWILYHLRHQGIPTYAIASLKPRYLAYFLIFHNLGLSLMVYVYFLCLTDHVSLSKPYAGLWSLMSPFNYLSLGLWINYFNHFIAKFFNSISHFSFTSLTWQILRRASKVVHVLPDNTRHRAPIGKEPLIETQLLMLPFQL